MTIIVLLILAAVAINLTIGENGIIKRAKDAVDIYNNKALEEQEMMNDAFKQKWAQTYVFDGGIISVDINGDFYFVDREIGELADKRIEIVSEEYIYCKDTNKYYYYGKENDLIYDGREYKKAIAIANSLLGINDGGNLIICTGTNMMEKDITQKYPELQGIKWKDLKNCGDDIIVLLTTTEDEKYIMDYDNGIIDNIETLFPTLKGIKINDIFDFDTQTNNIIALTEDGKLILATPTDLNTLQIEGKIMSLDLYSGVIETENGEFLRLSMDEEQNIVAKKIEEIYSELNGKKIKKVTDGWFITEDEEFYIPINENELVNIKKQYKELENKKIIDVISRGLLTDNGEFYTFKDENELSLLAKDIKEIRSGYDLLILKNKDGYEGYWDYDFGKLIYPNINNKEIKMNINLKNVKTIKGNFILLENGDLYQIKGNEEESNAEKINDIYFNGKKILYLDEIYMDDEICFIAEDYTIFATIMGGNIEEYPELKNNKFKQFNGIVAITEEGKLECEGEFSEEEKEMIDGKVFVKINNNLALDSEGIIYAVGNNQIENVNNMLGMNNTKFIDIDGNCFLDENGHVYHLKDGQLINISSDEKSKIYNMKIVKVSGNNGIVACINNEGNKYIIGKGRIKR